jgi:hypothetical protein
MPDFLEDLKKVLFFSGALLRYHFGCALFGNTA